MDVATMEIPSSISCVLGHQEKIVEGSFISTYFSNHTYTVSYLVIGMEYLFAQA